MKTKLQIKSIYGSVLFEYECEDNSIKKTLEKAIKDNADLRNANLEYANLYNANLSNANLSNADLSNANLENANLENANLENANLENANLSNADKIPMFCKWSYGITNNKIHIGCEIRSIEDWDEFFQSDKIINTKRDTPEFKQIEAVYKGLKAYLTHLNS